MPLGLRPCAILSLLGTLYPINTRVHCLTLTSKIPNETKDAFVVQKNSSFSKAHFFELTRDTPFRHVSRETKDIFMSYANFQRSQKHQYNELCSGFLFQGKAEEF